MGRRSDVSRLALAIAFTKMTQYSLAAVLSLRVSRARLDGLTNVIQITGTGPNKSAFRPRRVRRRGPGAFNSSSFTGERHAMGCGLAPRNTRDR